ncbi:MAG: hypothetical protein ACHRXM_15935 [Isosphaerales bacterium]
MNAAVGSESSQERPRGWQVSLADLIVLVLAAGVAAGIARGARNAWGVRTSPTISPVPIERTVGLLLEVTAVFLIVILVREVMRFVRGRQDLGPIGRGARVWALAWRVAAVALLLWFVAYESSVLRLDSASWEASYGLRQGLFPVCALLATLGLALGMGAGAIFGERPRQVRRPYWLFVPLAGLVSLLIVAQADSSVIPYLVLCALESVTNALRHRLAAGPGLSARLLRAGMDAAAAFAVCLALALVVAREFERARRSEPWATSRLGRFLRVVLLMTTAATGIYVARVTIPAIHPWFAEGFLLVLGRGEVLLILTGFGVFAMGLAARALVHPPSGERPRWPTLLSAFLRCCGWWRLWLSFAWPHCRP